MKWPLAKQCCTKCLLSESCIANPCRTRRLLMPPGRWSQCVGGFDHKCHVRFSHSTLSICQQNPRVASRQSKAKQTKKAKQARQTQAKKSNAKKTKQTNKQSKQRKQSKQSKQSKQNLLCLFSWRRWHLRVCAINSSALCNSLKKQKLNIHMHPVT